MEYKYRTFVISDIHLGMHECLHKELVQFLKKYLDAEYLNFPSSGGHLSPIKNTLFAWFGMINPNSLGGLLETKKKLIPILIKQRQIENLRVLSSTVGSDKIIIRRNYYPGIDLTMRSVAELLLRDSD